MAFSELLDLDTFVAVKKAAPKVSQVPFDTAQMAVKALAEFSNTHADNRDFDGQKYWRASLKELAKIAGLEEGQVSSRLFGAAYRTMGLTSWREMDGYFAAWSQAQLKILMKYFKVTTGRA